MEWVVSIARVPAEPSRHRVAVWRELRRIGAVSLGGGAWALPATPTVEAGLERVIELVSRSEGEIWMLEGVARDQATASKLEADYTAAREDEWAEFLADCDKYLAEIDREITKGKFTLAELEEEEQRMERLRRWQRELALRDVFGTASAPEAERRLKECDEKLDDFTDRVFYALGGQ